MEGMGLLEAKSGLTLERTNHEHPPAIDAA